jgi:hypothetical protein
VPELPEEPLLADVPLEALDPEVPLVPDVAEEPLFPLVPLEPLVPVVPDVPVDAEEPLVPEVPDVPLVPSAPVRFTFHDVNVPVPTYKVGLKVKLPFAFTYEITSPTI